MSLVLTQSPIFIHSLFRAGSTYLFNCFRRSADGYWCYQEPLNEYLLNAKQQPNALLQLHKTNATHLRHPEIGRPYFYEFFPLAAEIGESFLPTFPYEDYFNNARPESEALCRYFSVLAKGAQGRPVFQECRSAGRVASLRACQGGTHVFLWRNPWDQWWSYKVDSHFEICNLQILAAKHVPSLFVELRDLLKFNLPDNDERRMVGQRLDASGSYTLFFALWYHAMLEALPQCDLDLNIDSLSLDNEYRNKCLTQLSSHGIGGLDFSDCAVPIGLYGKEDIEFFTELEQRVIDLFLRHGCSGEDAKRIQNLREAHDWHGEAEDIVRAKAAREFDHLRQLARRLESELSIAQREGDSLLRALKSKEAENEALATALATKQSEYVSLASSLADTEARMLHVKTSLADADASLSRIKTNLANAEAELSRIKATRYWRWGGPLRRFGDWLKSWQTHAKGQ